MNNSNDPIGSQTRDDLPACRAVPQPTAPLHTPRKYRIEANIRRTKCTGVYYIQKSNTRLSASSCYFIKLHIPDDDFDDDGELSNTAL